MGGYAISGKPVWCAGVFRPHDKPAGSQASSSQETTSKDRS